MVKSFISGLFHNFMASRLQAEMPAAEENLVVTIVQRNVASQPAMQRRPVRNPFGLGGLVNDWRLDVPHVGAL